ncbi:class I SAM-dependent methyltransferase [Chloroflexota bacterium]
MGHADVNNQFIIETVEYLYRNPITRWLINMGHGTCARLSQFDTRGTMLIDLGCATGAHFRYVKKAGVISLDISREVLVKTKKQMTDAHSFIQADIFKLPFKDNSVTSILSFTTVEYLSPMEKALMEVHRVLSDKGEFIIAIHTEGFLHKLGRALTTKQHAKRIMGVDNYEEIYAEIIANKNIGLRSILQLFNSFFVIQKVVGVPFLIPSIHLNLFLVVRYTKRRHVLPRNT